jgi:hypothetical protein
VRAEPQVAADHYRDALDDFGRVQVAQGRYELSLRLPLLLAYGDIGVTAAGSELGLVLTRDALSACRDQFDRVGVLLGEPDWLKRERLFVDALLATARFLDKEDSFPQLDSATEGLAKYVREHPTDDQGHLQYGMALLNRGMANSLKERWEEGRADLVRSREVLRSLAPRMEAARSGWREASLMLARLAAAHGQELLDATPSKPTQAREWVEIGLAALADVEKEGPLSAEEQKIRAKLEAMRKRATP